MDRMGDRVWPEDTVYEQYRNANERQRPALERELFHCVKRHAETAVYHKMGERIPDLVNEIVNSVFKRLVDFRGEAKFSTWVHRFALNKVKDEMRRRCRYRKVFDEKTTVDDADNNRLLNESPEDWFLSADVDRLREGLSRSEAILFDMQREGMEDSQIARMLGKTTEAVESRWRRLKSKIRKKHPLTTDGK